MLKPSKHSGMVNPNHALPTVSQNSSSGKTKTPHLKPAPSALRRDLLLLSRATIVHFPSFDTHEFQLAKGVRSKKLRSKEQNHPHHKHALNGDKWNSVYHRTVKFTISPFQGCAETVQNRYWGWSPLQVSGLAARWMKITVQLIAWCTE